jgi:hypothetical protein
LKFGNKLPNGASLLLHQVCKNKTLLNRMGLMKKFSAGVPNELLGAEFVKDFKVSSFKLSASEIIKSSHLIPTNDELNSFWVWEEFCSQPDRHDFICKQQPK